jgi:transcriptional regulator with XRE-family HTH domain
VRCLKTAASLPCSNTKFCYQKRSLVKRERPIFRLAALSTDHNGPAFYNLAPFPCYRYKMNITVNDELLAYIDPLTPEEHAALERSILAEGCRDALVLWGDVLVDGHNRYGICTKHNIPYTTVQNPRFKTIDDVHLWMIDQHLGRRSVSDFQRGVLALRKKDILAGRDIPAPADSASEMDTSGPAPWEAPAAAPVAPASEPTLTREALAKAARISSNTISQIEKIQKTATPELVAAVKAGTISINTAATVASLPVEEQVAAAAGGKKELQQAARQVRAAKAVERTEPESPEGIIARLKQTVTELTAENAALKAQLAALGA